jgi:tRNA splicing endonuclease
MEEERKSIEAKVISYNAIGSCQFFVGKSVKFDAAFLDKVNETIRTIEIVGTIRRCCDYNKRAFVCYSDPMDGQIDYMEFEFSKLSAVSL